MPPANRASFVEALEVLERHGVEFIVVGGVAAVLAGAPIVTFDLDVLVPQDGATRKKLLAALVDLEASYRDPAGRRIEPTAARLEKARMNFFKTRLGDLDVLAEIGAGQTYESLLPRSQVLGLGALAIRVLDLDAVIETKEQSGRPKDRMVLFDLKETLRLKRGE